jgi:hypothetical protein
MKSIAISLVWLSTLSLQAREPALDQLGGPLAITTNCEIQWLNSATLSSSSATVYRVTQTKFSPAVISNIMALAGFDWADRTNINNGLCEDRGTLYFADKEQTRALVFVPCRGQIGYSNSRAVAPPGQSVSGVPTEEGAVELALGIVDLLGVDRSQLSKRPGSNELRHTRAIQSMTQFDKTQRRLVTTIIARELFFGRTIEGVECSGIGVSGGIWFSFGNDGQLAELEMVWRNVVPYRQYRVANRQELTERLRKGKCVLQSEELDDDVRKLTINSVTPYYFEYRADEPQQFIYPYTVLEAEAETATTNRTVRICCPLLDAN